MNSSTQEVLSMLTESQDQIFNSLKQNLSKIRAGKANPSMLSSVMVEAYGSMMPLNQVANVNATDARTLTIQPFDKSVLGEIERGILGANLGLTPMNDGEFVRLSLPVLTEERRKELSKQAKAMCEQAKVNLRSARKDAMDAVKALGSDTLSEDEVKDGESAVQSSIDNANKTIDSIYQTKDSEIMAV